jgi:lipopolysaccharide export LptBFGC system permease protein LptF
MAQIALSNETRRRSARAFRLSAMPRRYTARIVGQIALQLTLIVVLIETIFLGEKFAEILELTLGQQTAWYEVAQLLAYTAPEIAHLALPIALLIAVYRVALRCREEREFLVLAGIGLGPLQFIALAMVLGVAAQIISVAISGFIEPSARFAYRATVFNSQHRALRGAITPGRFYYFNKYVVFAPPKGDNTPERGLFIDEALGQDRERVIVANRASLEGPDQAGRMKLHLRDFTVTSFETVGGLESQVRADGPPRTGRFRGSLRIGNYAQEWTLDDVLYFPPRGVIPSEWSLLELLHIAPAPAPAGSAHLNEAWKIIGRSFLCLFAPLIAGLALIFTDRGTRAFALPVACAALMCIDVAASTTSRTFVPSGIVLVLVAHAMVACGILVVLVRQIFSRQHALVTPTLARA